MTDRHYPITPAPPDRLRVTFGLAMDVAAVVESHGFPPITGSDFDALQAALVGFLFGEPA